MEGEDIEKGIADIQKDSSKVFINPALPIVLLFIGIIIGSITYPFISGIMEEKEPIYQQYTTIEGENNTVFKNEKLDVVITKHIINSEDYFVAEWIREDGTEFHSYACQTPNECLDDVLTYAEELSVNQLKWYQYMLKNVVK